MDAMSNEINNTKAYIIAFKFNYILDIFFVWPWTYLINQFIKTHKEPRLQCFINN